jgi:hypothetical protein
MRPAARRFLALVATPRAMLALTLCLGLMASSVGEDAYANLTTVVTTDPSAFQSGTVDIAGLLAGSTASEFPSATAFKWDTAGGGADCASIMPQLDTTAQALTPGKFCVGRITLRNTNPKSVDAWFRMRLVRGTPAGSTATEALNNRLRLYMHEYTSGTARTAAAYQAADCTTANYRPVSPVAGTARSTATVPDVTDAGQGSRTALLSVGAGGKNIGRHPGISSPADAAVSSLSNSGFGLTAGTGVGTAPATSAVFGTLEAGFSTNMSTDPATASTYNAVNLIGNDEVTNPRLISNSNTPNGTRPAGALLDAQLNSLAVRYYCVAIYFPSDSDLTSANGAGDNAAAGSSATYYLAVSASQKSKRTVN